LLHLLVVLTPLLFLFLAERQVFIRQLELKQLLLTEVVG